MFVELNTRQDGNFTVILEWDRDTGATQIVLADHGDASLAVFPVLGAHAGDAFRHPLGYMRREHRRRIDRRTPGQRSIVARSSIESDG